MEFDPILGFFHAEQTASHLSFSISNLSMGRIFQLLEQAAMQRVEREL